MAQAKANKWEILNFIESEEIISAYDLMERFSYTHSYACKKLSLLKKQGLVQDMGNTPSTHRGQWCLTSKGDQRLYYLSKKLGVLTQREKRQWQAWVEQEMGKPFEQQRIWRVEGAGIRMVKEGESGTTLNEAKSVMEFNRSMAR
jgi:hypothetical protein